MEVYIEAGLIKQTCCIALTLLISLITNIAYAVPTVSMTTSDTAVSMPIGGTTTATYTVVNTSGIFLNRVEYYAPPLARVTGGTCITSGSKGIDLAVGATCTVILTIGPSNKAGNIKLEPLGMCGQHRTVCASADQNNQVTTTIGGTTPPVVSSPLYINNFFGVTISVFDPTTNTVTATIPTGDRPEKPALTPDGSRLYVSNFDDDTVSVIDTTTNSVINTITGTGSFPADIAITLDGARAYVMNRGVASVDVISTATNTITSTIALPAGSTDDSNIVMNSAGTRAYIPAQGNDTLNVINTTSSAFVTGIPFSNTGIPQQASINSAGTRVYVPVPNTSGSLSVVDTATNSEIADISLPFAPGGVVGILPDDSRIYVPMQSGIAVVNAATNTVITTIPNPPWSVSISITPDGTRAYATNFQANTVTAIDTATNTVITTIPVGIEPRPILAGPNNARVYVLNKRSDSLSVIDVATNTVIATVALGSLPDHIVALFGSSP